jgi:hypothetical protein
MKRMNHFPRKTTRDQNLPGLQERPDLLSVFQLWLPGRAM